MLSKNAVSLWQRQKDSSRLSARTVLLHFVQRSPPETRTPRHASRASESNRFTQCQNKNGHLSVTVSVLAGAEGLSRLSARSVLLHFVQRSPSETRTPRHAPRAECSNFPIKQKETSRRCLFLFGRGRRIRTLGTRFWRPLLYQLSYAPIKMVGHQGLEPRTDRL